MLRSDIVAIVESMTAKLTISFSDEVLDALRASKSITVKFDSHNGARRGGRQGMEEPRAGSLPARVIDWAQTRKKSFGTLDITKKKIITLEFLP